MGKDDIAKEIKTAKTEEIAINTAKYSSSSKNSPPPDKPKKT